jgi:hypothetical protein
MPFIYLERYKAPDDGRGKYLCIADDHKNYTISYPKGKYL